ncbi:MAG: SigE family RNA polymerase sigma factor [Nocardioides sp.]
MCVDRGVEDFEEWAHARSRALARSAFLLTGDRQLAEDLVQETLIRVADRWRQVRRSGAPDAYAQRVMHNLSIDWWRRRRVRPAEVAESGPLLTSAHRGDEDLVGTRLVLGEALARLTARQRAVLSLRFYEDLSESQTAGVLGCSVNTVKSQTRHALGRLRDLAPELLAAFDVQEEVR